MPSDQYGTLHPHLLRFDAEDLAHIFLSQVFAKHGTPTDMSPIEGSTFILHFWRSLCQPAAVSRPFSHAYHPETDGQMNESTRSWNNIFGYTSIQQDDWVDFLPLSKFRINNTSHRHHGHPLLCQQGFHLKLEVPLFCCVGCCSLHCSDLKELHQYLMTRSLAPSNSTRPTQPHINSLSAYSGR